MNELRCYRIMTRKNCLKQSDFRDFKYDFKTKVESIQISIQLWNEIHGLKSQNSNSADSRQQYIFNIHFTVTETDSAV